MISKLLGCTAAAVLAAMVGVGVHLADAATMTRATGTVPTTQLPAAAPALPAVPSAAPVANLIALRSMTAEGRAGFLHQMTDAQLVDLQQVAVTTPPVLRAANAEAAARGLPQLQRGPDADNGAAQAVPLGGDRQAPAAPVPAPLGPPQQQFHI